MTLFGAPLQAREVYIDTDQDGEFDRFDMDDDNDELSDIYEITISKTDPLNPDTDGDTIQDRYDAFPLDNTETTDTDGDYIGDNADLDDDGDGLPDTWEITYKLNPLDRSDVRADADRDGHSNLEEFQKATNPMNAKSNPSKVINLALDTQHLIWKQNAIFDWYPQKNEYQLGDMALRSGPVQDHQTSRLKTKFTGPGYLSFFWKVSSETDYDKLSVYINNIKIDYISGEIDWQYKKITLPSKRTYTVEWVYSKDASNSVGADAGWLDSIKLNHQPITIKRKPEKIWGDKKTKTILPTLLYLLN